MKSFRRYLIICTVLSFTGAHMTPASAHTTLVSSSPANGSLISVWPSEIVLTFAEPLATISGSSVNQVTVTNAEANDVGGKVTVNGEQITVATTENALPGPVLVNYRVAASDGHVVEGEFTFSYQPTGTANPTPSPTASPAPAHGHNSPNGAIIKASTGLVVLALIIGIFGYRRKL